VYTQVHAIGGGRRMCTAVVKGPKDRTSLKKKAKAKLATPIAESLATGIIW
jgi:hypothetical protein